jgi:hypothetical protein
MTNIQTLSVIIPAKNNGICVNRCKFGVCFLCKNKYENRLQDSHPDKVIHAWEDYTNRLNIVRDQNTDTVILTGDAEPMSNQEAISLFAYFNKNVISSPFRIIELQTAGNNLDDKTLGWLRNTIGVTLISLSLSSFDNDLNGEITRNKKPIDIKNLCKKIKEYGFNLRLSLNLNTEGFKVGSVEYYSDVERGTISDWYPSVELLLKEVQELGADQLTLRKLWEDGSDSDPAKWVREFGVKSSYVGAIQEVIKEKSIRVGELPFGADLYSYNGLSVVVDSNSQGLDTGKDIKYLVLGPDCKLYRDWEKTLYA